MNRFLLVMAFAGLLLSCAATVLPFFGAAMGVGQ
jgi:hypothetical protein